MLETESDQCKDTLPQLGTNKIIAFESVQFDEKDIDDEFKIPNEGKINFSKDSVTDEELSNELEVDLIQEVESIEEEAKRIESASKDLSSNIPPLNMKALEIKRVGTTGGIIKNVYKWDPPKREGLETAKTARRMVNGDTQREILGNVWINDGQTFVDSKGKQTDNYTKKSTLDQGANAKKSTNIGDDNWIDDYDNILKGDASDTNNFKFTVTNYDKKRTSLESSLMAYKDKYDEKESFSSLNSEGFKQQKK